MADRIGSGRPRVRTRAAAIALGAVAALALGLAGVRQFERDEIRHAGEGLAAVATGSAWDLGLILHERVSDVSVLAQTLASAGVPPDVATEELRIVKASSAHYLMLAV